jgi:tetratricopeptide (TPR) repeat protein
MAKPDPSKPKEPPKPVQIGGESLVDRILPHIKQITYVVIGAAVVVAVIFGVRWWLRRGDEKKTAALAETLRLAQRPIALPEAKPDPEHPAFADPTDRAKALLDQLSKEDATPPGHAYRAGLLVAAGDLDKAMDEYKAGQDAEGLEGVVCREGIGIVLEARAAAEKDAAARNKLYEEALATYQRMQPDEKGPRRAYALYHQGRMQALLGKTADAKASFEKASELLKSEQHHELRELVQKRLAALGAA